MNIAEVKRVYCIGLGGVGVSAVAKYFLARGATVRGSDPNRNPLVDDLLRLGATWWPDERPERLAADVDLVVYTDDAHPDHPLRRRAEQLGIPSQNFSVTLGLIMDGYRQRLAVAGTNGKSTTTALLGLLLADAGLDPAVFIGSRLSDFNGNLRLGRNDVFVAEADEYRDHFLNLRPTAAVITNVELDHVDYFRNDERLLTSFRKFAQDVTADHLVINGDDQRLVALFPQAVTFGFSQAAQLQAPEVRQAAGQQTFTAVWRGSSLGEFTLRIPGRFNIANAMAAMAAALVAGASPMTFPATLERFRGIWRRFQVLTAPASPVTVVSDYAHHPTAVRVTLEGAKAFYPGRRLLAVFQPHHHNRLTALFDDFVKSFVAADHSIIVETYTVPGREPQTNDVKTSRQLVAALAAQGRAADYALSPAEAETMIRHIAQPGDVVLVMGAGNVWRIGETLAAAYAL